MTLYLASNAALDTVQTVTGGQSITNASAFVTLQIGIPTGQYIYVTEYGVSFDGSAAATPIRVVLETTATATTLGTAHSTTTVKPYNSVGGGATTMTMSTAATAFGATIPVSRTALRVADRQYVAPTNQYVKIWPEGRYFEAGNSAAAEYLQLTMVNPGATVNCLAYIIFDER